MYNMYNIKFNEFEFIKFLSCNKLQTKIFEATLYQIFILKIAIFWERLEKINK